MEKFNKPTSNAETVPDPRELMREAKRMSEVNAAVKAFYPQDKIRELIREYEKIANDYGKTENTSYEDFEAKIKNLESDLQNQVGVELAEFTDSIVSVAGDRPEVLLSAHNILYMFNRQGLNYVSTEDEQKYLEFYKTKIFEAIKTSTENGTDLDDILEKCKDYDSYNILSTQIGTYAWKEDVKSQLG